LADLSRKRIQWFVQAARRVRGLPLAPNTTTRALLAHLNLIADGRPTNAAVLLFSANPQRFHTTAHTKCVHCHGTEYRRPFGSLQVYGGDLFEQADQAKDFVLAKIHHSVGTREQSLQAPRQYDLPPDAVGEAIVNAVAHRDYNSNASVEVRLFADRLEVWNPGALPGTLTLDDLRGDHPSIPGNPLVAESLYLAGYIERVGSGTQAMIRLCREAGLPEPAYEVRHGFFVLTLWRDWLTRDRLAGLALNERQYQALAVIRTQGRITNRGYREMTQAIVRTASRDLDDLVARGLLAKVGQTGRGTYYVLAGKPDKNRTKRTLAGRSKTGQEQDKPAIMGPKPKARRQARP